MGDVGVEPIAAAIHIKGNCFTDSRIEHRPIFVGITAGIYRHSSVNMVGEVGLEPTEPIKA